MVRIAAVCVLVIGCASKQPDPPGCVARFEQQARNGELKTSDNVYADCIDRCGSDAIAACQHDAWINEQMRARRGPDVAPTRDEMRKQLTAAIAGFQQQIDLAEAQRRAATTDAARANAAQRIADLAEAQASIKRQLDGL